MSDDSGLRPTPAQHQPPMGGPSSDPARYAARDDGTARDQLLDRAVAIRSVDVAHADDLQREARFLARLDHASLPCVHDFVRGDGGATLVSRAVVGRSLTQAVIAAAGGESIPTIAGPTACALTFIKVCDALVSAHLRGVVHRALTPDVIIIGDDGQVVVDGWRGAMEALERPATLRFIANAPVPSALPLDGLHEDIRGIGVCLYAALMREAPPRDRDGGLAETSFEAAHRIPSPLAAVVRKAMASDAAKGYATVRDVRSDLERFLAGQTPKAFTPGPVTAAMHWLEVNRRPVLVAMLIVCIAVGAALAFTWNEVKTYAAWGPPLVDEHFDDNGWKDRWTVRGGGSGPGAWELRDGRLVTTADYDSYLVFRQRLSAPVAIEYVARFAADVRPGDLSVWWCEGEPLAEGPGRNPFDLPGWFFQAGAYENSWCSIRQAPGQIRAAVANRTLAAGVDHRIRVEIEGSRMTMSVDGELTLDYTDIFPATSGYLALYGYFPGKAFDHVRIWQREVPELISPLAIGDEAYRTGRLPDAVADYRRVAASHAGTALGERALFLQGLTLRRLGDREGAWKAWQRMPDGELRHRTDALAIDDVAEAGQVRQAAERFTDMWNKRPELHDELRQRWQAVGQHLSSVSPHSEADLRLWCAAREACFGADQASAWLAADILMALGAWDEIVRKFPDEHRPVALALLSLGRPEEVASSTWAVSNERIMAMMEMGEVEAVLKSPYLHRDMRTFALCKFGQAEQTLKDGGYPGLLYLGRADELLAQTKEGDGTRAEVQIVAGQVAAAAAAGDQRALILLGRLDEAERSGADVGLYRLLSLLVDGRTAEAKALRPHVTGNRNAKLDALWFAQGIGLALIDAALGDPAAVRTALQRGGEKSKLWGGRQALVCRAALDPAGDAAVAAMQWRSEAVAWGHIATALRSELAGDRSAALAAWQAFKALPSKDRLLDGNGPNVEVEAFASWRIAALAH